MGRPKRSKKQDYQNALNEIEDIKADEMRDLMSLNYKIMPKFRSKKQKELSEIIKSNRITIINGSAGTGKSFIALKTGLEMMKDPGSGIGDMLLSTPIIEVSRVSLGSLPGSLEEKTFNYFQHFYDNIEKIVGTKVMKFLKGSGLVNDRIVNFIRGATFGKSDDNGNPVGTFCIFDESQNFYPSEVKAILSRLGEKSKIILCGDLDQCDLHLRGNEINGLQDAYNRFKDMDGVGYFEFTEDDIVRDPFLIDIMKRYKDK
jgi:phosphate starvation-inducible protein PhoH and related proteins